MSILHMGIGKRDRKPFHTAVVFSNLLVITIVCRDKQWKEERVSGSFHIPWLLACESISKYLFCVCSSYKGAWVYRREREGFHVHI